jgi:hypothetical protein
MSSTGFRWLICCFITLQKEKSKGTKWNGSLRNRKFCGGGTSGPPRVLSECGERPGTDAAFGDARVRGMQTRNFRQLCRQQLKRSALCHLHKSLLLPFIRSYISIYLYIYLHLLRSAVLRDFSLLHSAQTGSGAHPASHAIGAGDCFPRDKAAGAWSWPLTSI